MFTAAMHLSVCRISSSIQTRWDELFLPTTKVSIAGAGVVAADLFDSELHFERTTIMFADVVESVRLIERDELVSIKRLRGLFQRMTDSDIATHAGTVLERRGDGLLVTFSSAQRAAACALAMHATCAAENALSGLEGAEIRLRIGLHCAKVLAGASGIYGHGVNIAARVAGIAQSAETVASQAVRDQLTNALDGDIEDLGECDLKNASAPVRLYKLWPTHSYQLRPAHDLLCEAARPTLAILPFSSPVRQSEGEVAGQLLADSLIAAVSRSSSVRVISRLSTLGIVDPQVFAGQHGLSSALNCSYVLSGSCISRSGGLVIYVELSEAKSGSVLWADQLNGSVEEILAPDSELLGRIVTETQIRIIDAEIALARVKPMPSLRSYTLFLSGLTLMHRQSQHDFQLSRRLFEHLIERHPSSAIPRAWLGKWFMLRVAQGWSTDERLDARNAGTHAMRALQYEPENSLCLVVKGVIDAYLSKNFESAETCYRSALQNNPNDALAHLQFGALCGWQGRGDEAVAAAHEALALSPLDPHMYFSHCLVAAAHLGAGDHVNAIKHGQLSLRANRMHVATHKVVAMAQAMSGAMSDANESIRRVQALSPEFTLSSFESSSPWRLHPRFADIRKSLAEAGLAEN